MKLSRKLQLVQSIKKLTVVTAGFAFALNALLLWSVLDPKLAFAATTISTISDNKVAGVPFNIEIQSDASGSVTITDETGTLVHSPVSISSGVPLTVPIRITKDSSGLSNNKNKLTVKIGGLQAAISNEFSVVADANMLKVVTVAGDGQVKSVRSALNTPFKVQTTDIYGNIVGYRNVNFSIINFPAGATGAKLSRTSGVTDSNGHLDTTLTLGNKVGTYVVRASVEGKDNADFYASASPGSLSTISVVPSAATLAQGSTQQFSLSAYDADRNPITLSSISWSVANGGGTIDGNGLFTAGSALGGFNNTIVAKVGSVQSTASITVMTISGQSSGGESPGSAEELRNTGILDRVEIMPQDITTPAGSQQLISAQGYDVFNNALATISYGWEATGDIGELTAGYGPTTLLNTALLPGTGSLQVTASQGDRQVTAQVPVSVVAGLGGRIEFSEIDTQQAGTPFRITITAKDGAGNIISSTPTPIVLTDSTGTITPRVVTELSAGVWTGEVTISSGAEEVVILANASGFSGASNGFKVEGESHVISTAGQTNKVLGFVDNNKVAFAIVAGLGLLGSAMALGLLGGKGLQAIGRNPLAKKQIFVNLYLNAGIAILAAFISIALALMLKNL